MVDLLTAIRAAIAHVQSDVPGSVVPAVQDALDRGHFG
jgi:hypothetical protein